MSKPFVATLTGSASDLPELRATLDLLKGLDIPFEIKDIDLQPELTA
ncbi:MAG: hypothetical protein ABW072_02400 [Sedimenticola sp.]